MSSPAQTLGAHNRQTVGRDARDVCPHAIEHVAKLLDIRFASCVINRGCSLSHHSRHENIGSTCDTRFVQKHIRSLQVVSTDFKQLMIGIDCEGSA